MDFSDYSRFRNTPQIIINGEETVGIWNSPTWIQTKPEDRYIGVFKVTNNYEGRPDLISNLLYGTTELDWILIAFNAIHYADAGARMCLNWPKTNDTIRYPLEEIVFPELI